MNQEEADLRAELARRGFKYGSTRLMFFGALGVVVGATLYDRGSESAAPIGVLLAVAGGLALLVGLIATGVRMGNRERG